MVPDLKETMASARKEVGENGVVERLILESKMVREEVWDGFRTGSATPL